MPPSVETLKLVTLLVTRREPASPPSGGARIFGPLSNAIQPSGPESEVELQDVGLETDGELGAKGAIRGTLNKYDRSR